MPLRTLDKWIAAELQSDLCDPEFAMGYLQACFDEAKTNNDMGIFVSAVQDVARANQSAALEPQSRDTPLDRLAAKSNRSKAKRSLSPA